MPPTVTIYGSGLAACCCARLLTQTEQFAVVCRSTEAVPGPTLLVNQSTQRLLADVFGLENNFFRDLPQIRERIVLWGPASNPTILPHAGAVVNESVLLAQLWNRVTNSRQSACGDADWSIYSSSQAAPGTQQRFGTRSAFASTVRLKQVDADACCVESLNSGWLFLLPCGGGNGSLLAIGGSPGVLLGQSRLVAHQIDQVVGSTSDFPVHPRILDPLCGSDWLACGSAAMGFDPICGEGAGNAVREAILASAVLRSNDGEALPHYSARLAFGFHRHLEACRQFYRAACNGAWWEGELAELERGIAWAQTRLQVLPQPRYRLNGFDLERL